MKDESRWDEFIKDKNKGSVGDKYGDSMYKMESMDENMM